jgi:hypothetical protein
MEVPAGTINPITGHMENADDLALHRAIGPDQPDPPSSAGRSRSEPPRIPFGWPRGGPPYQGPPGGGFGGPPGGGGPFRGPPGGGGPPGGPPMPMPAAPPIPAAPHDSKLVGNPPIIFKGEKSQAEEFITQWELYEGVNINNTLMRNTYQRAMLFLTYIQGPLVNEWVKGVNAWLRNQIISQHWATHDERLWDSTIGVFNRQYADVLEQEKAQAELAKGLQLRNGDLDALITQFETLVRHANYDVNQPLVMQIFTDALPHAMYGYIINHVKPRDYEGWREAAIQQQKTWVHMKSRLNWFAPKTAKPRNQFSNWKPNNQWGRPNMGQQTDPNAMDTTPDRIRGRLADAEEILPGGNRHEEHNRGRKEGGIIQRKVFTCYNCGKIGHFRTRL